MVHAKRLGLILCAAVFAYLLVTSGYFRAAKYSSPPDQVASFKLFIDNRSELEQWEQHELGVSAHFGGDGKPTSNNNISMLPGYSTVITAVSQDVARSQERFRRFASSYQHRPRFFDVSWLSAADTSFLLTSVVIRPDRFRVSENICGELRFIYRLGYEKKVNGGEATASSDLPMTLNLIYDIKNDACTGQIQDIASLLQEKRNAAGGVKKLFAGQGGANRIEYNFQINRYPHDGSETFSDQAHYGLAVLKRNEINGQWERSVLENTPDVERLLSDRKTLADLWHWINDPENTRAIAGGIFQIPDRFLVKSAISVTPNGLLRSVNRPFFSLFSKDAFAVIKNEFFNNKEQLLRRLDESTCAGCHVSRSIAGFHGIGQARNTKGYFNNMIRPMSAYFYAIQNWRTQMLASPDSYAKPMPSPGRLIPFAAACGRPDGSFNSWTCTEGLSCNMEMPTGSIAETGMCLPPKENYSGAPCDHSFLQTDLDPLFDKFMDVSQKGCELPNLCTKSIYGFPGGFCTTGCSEADTDIGGANRCSQIPKLGPFTECLETGGSFAHCLISSHAQVLMPRCSGHDQCRPDYLCAATGDGQGICAPQYFLHQLTIENHPL